jgi:hypothetical protein
MQNPMNNKVIDSIHVFFFPRIIAKKAHIGIAARLAPLRTAKIVPWYS